MNIIENILIGVSVSADAFAVSISSSLNNIEKKQLKKIPILFGLFQMLMPLLGYIIGSSFNNIFITINHYISFILLTVIGTNMIYDTYKNKEIKINNNTLIILAISTSIDALIIGIAYYFEYKSKYLLRTFIIVGFITYITSLIGTKIGYKLKEKLNNKSQLIGGIILIALAIKILIEHL